MTPPSRRRPRASRVVASLLAVIAVTALTGCNIQRLLPSDDRVDPASGGGADLVGTTWSGTDSDGDVWVFDFQEDGTVGLSFGGSSFDDPSDVWKVEGDTLAITVQFDEGEAVLAGGYEEGTTSIDLDGRQGDLVWTVTITPQ